MRAREKIRLFELKQRLEQELLYLAEVAEDLAANNLISSSEYRLAKYKANIAQMNYDNYNKQVVKTTIAETKWQSEKLEKELNLRESDNEVERLAQELALVDPNNFDINQIKALVRDLGIAKSANGTRRAALARHLAKKGIDINNRTPDRPLKSIQEPIESAWPADMSMAERLKIVAEKNPDFRPTAKISDIVTDVSEFLGKDLSNLQTDDSCPEWMIAIPLGQATKVVVDIPEEESKRTNAYKEFLS